MARWCRFVNSQNKLRACTTEKVGLADTSSPIQRPRPCVSLKAAASPPTSSWKQPEKLVTDLITVFLIMPWWGGGSTSPVTLIKTFLSSPLGLLWILWGYLCFLEIPSFCLPWGGLGTYHPVRTKEINVMAEIGHYPSEWAWWGERASGQHQGLLGDMTGTWKVRGQQRDRAPCRRER